MIQRESIHSGIGRTVAALFFLILTTAASVKAQQLTAEDRASIVEKLAVAIEEGYVLEAKGRDLAAQLRSMQAAGDFTEDNPGDLAEALSTTLREISGDLHFRVNYGSMAGVVGGPQRRMVRVSPGEPERSAGGERRVMRVPAGQPQPSEGGERRMVRVAPGNMGAPAGGEEMSAEMSALFGAMAARFPDNYRAEILAGNVGLLEIDILFPPHDRLDEAMKLLADTDALILDLRSCPGGTGMTTRPLESVFFAESTELVTMAVRGEDPEPVMSTDETPGGVKYLDKPVFVLTSKGTGSACEEVAWCLKYHDKAVLVGETTAGAGHGISAISNLGHDLSATIPNMMPIHPNFEGGWEVIGVPPDVTIGSRSAADEAHLLALNAIMEHAEGSKLSEVQSVYAATAMEVGRRQSEYVDQGRSLRSYSASFEDGRRLHVKDGELYYTSEGGRTIGPLLATDEPDQFELGGGIQRMILEVERDGSGEIQAITISRAGSEEQKRFKRVRP